MNQFFVVEAQIANATASSIVSAPLPGLGKEIGVSKSYPGNQIQKCFRVAQSIACTVVTLSGAALLVQGTEPSSRAASDQLNRTLVNAPKKAADLPVTNMVSPSMQASPLESTNILRSFLTRGVIREVPQGGQTLIVKHEDIPGFMPKMTMEFNVRNTNEIRGLLAGDTIVFNVKANEKESWIEGIQRSATNTWTAPLSSDPSSSQLLNIAQLKPGQILPDAELLSETGTTIQFSDFRGSALAFTFIFTRCPLPDFCPRMNQHFARVRELLQQNTNGPTNWQLLTISFDPEFDKPGVLSRYAYSYRGQSPERWLFAVAPTNVMAALVNQLNFRFAKDGGSFIHNLRTVVIDTQGRLVSQFEGNKWKAADLAESMIRAATSDPQH